MKLLIANRGEIAVRVIRTAHRMDISCVAVYSDADADALHVRMADERMRIGPAAAVESYLKIDNVIEAALSSGATHVHPGYGFLSENPAFVRACDSAGLSFVGPPADVVELLGDKGRAKQIAAANGVPVLAGGTPDDQSESAIAELAAEVGFPLMVKAVAGGGGKGMSVVRDAGELSNAVSAAKRVAASAFGDDRVMLERFLDSPRHVEVQILADTHGNVIHLGERDCSLQRRHQKVIEESPAPNLDPALRDHLCNSAVALARAAGYTNAGTCEFLVGADGTAGFIEVNARLQVEHPVTEMVTGVDLVEWQLRVARGEKLDVEPKFNGHAVEARVYAEDPDSDFLPQSGPTVHIRWPSGVRVDSGVTRGVDVPSHYDPMVAKVIAHAVSRDEAVAALASALRSTEILGFRTNVAWLAGLMSSDAVVEGTANTATLADLEVEVEPKGRCAEDAVLRYRLARTIPDPLDPWGRPVPPAGEAPEVVFDGDPMVFSYGGRRVVVANDSDAGFLVWDNGQVEIAGDFEYPDVTSVGGAHLAAPMPGAVTRVEVTQGEDVDEGQVLVVVEAMKMEHAIRAPKAGTVTSLHCAAGDQVLRGQVLVDVG